MTRFFLMICLVGALASSALCQDIPKNDGWVTDLAGMLSGAQEQQLESLMESYRQGTTHEIALLTVPDLDGGTIERFALQVAREWKIGTGETSNGALLVVAKAERKLRIETGRGLEGNLPDVVCGRIIRDVITPLFKKGRFPEGIHQGIVAMHQAIGGEYGMLDRSRSAARKAGGLGGIIIVLLFFLFMFINRGRGGHGSGGSIWTMLMLGQMMSGGSSRGFGGGGMGGLGGGGGGGGGGFGGFGGGGGFSGGGASGGW